MKNQILEAVLQATDFTKSEKETLSEILTSKQAEKERYLKDSVHYKRLTLQIEKIEKHLKRLA